MVERNPFIHAVAHVLPKLTGRGFEPRSPLSDG
jgi:hypothetical protein